MRCATNSRCALLAAAGMAVALAGCGGQAPPSQAAPSTGIRFLGGGSVPAGFARALAPRPFVFPRDHAAHPRFRTEWWYFTGNLSAAGGRHFGFELTFFRIALAPSAVTSPSAWTSDQVWMAHFAVSDVPEKRMIADERLSRGALDLAGANAEPFRVWVEDWSASADQGIARGPIHLRARGSEAAIDLQLNALGPPVAQGQGGLDRKGPEPGNASYYYSVPRLAVSGTLQIGQRTPLSVDGQAWMDREWSSSALSDDIAGWEWFGLQLSDGRSLMYYRLRGKDGQASPFSSGSLIGRDGRRRTLEAGQVRLDSVRSWRSPATRINYPVAWRMTIPDADLDLRIEPYMPNQELRLSVMYWEGAVRLTGTSAGEKIGGEGYLELAGY